MYQVIILGCILAASLYFSKRPYGSKLNMPPLVRYKFPIIGHTFDYLYNAEEFLKQCRKEYGDIFSIYVWGSVITIVGKEHIYEVLTRDDVFNFYEAFRTRVPMDVLFKYGFGHDAPDRNIKIVKESISKKMGLYNERMQKALTSGIKKEIEECEEPKMFYNFYKHIANIIAAPVANIFLGEGEEKDDDVISAFAEITKTAAMFTTIPPIFDFIFPGLQIHLFRIVIKLGLYNPVFKHRDLLIQRIKYQVHKRLQEKQTYGDSWERPNNLLQDLMEEESLDLNNINYEEMADKMIALIFAAIHTTSRGSANALMDLASRPEYMQELYEEQLEIHKEADENGVIPFEALKKMIKLDSFLRESLRLTGDITSMHRLVLKDFTFSNGLQLPKGRKVEMYSSEIHLDQSLQGTKPKSFEPFRHLKPNVSSTKVSRTFVVFGGAKHACPGRFFATNEIKLLLHNAILRYNFRTESGKVEQRSKFGPVSLPSFNGIIFEKR